MAGRKSLVQCPDEYVPGIGWVPCGATRRAVIRALRSSQPLGEIVTSSGLPVYKIAHIARAAGLPTLLQRHLQLQHERALCTQAVVRLALRKGHKAVAIAQQHGLTIFQVRGAIARLRERGELPEMEGETSPNPSSQPSRPRADTPRQGSAPVFISGIGRLPPPMVQRRIIKALQGPTSTKVLAKRYRVSTAILDHLSQQSGQGNLSQRWQHHLQVAQERARSKISEGVRQGLNLAEIARRLEVSCATVRRHIRELHEEGRLPRPEPESLLAGTGKARLWRSLQPDEEFIPGLGIVPTGKRRTALEVALQGDVSSARLRREFRLSLGVLQQLVVHAGFKNLTARQEVIRLRCEARLEAVVRQGICRRLKASQIAKEFQLPITDVSKAIKRLRAKGAYPTTEEISLGGRRLSDIDEEILGFHHQGLRPPAIAATMRMQAKFVSLRVCVLRAQGRIP